MQDGLRQTRCFLAYTDMATRIIDSVIENKNFIRVVMLVVDGNDVQGDQFLDLDHLSPAVHPAVQGLLDGLSSQENLECCVLYGKRNGLQEETRRVGSVVYTSVPYQRLPLPGLGYVARLLALRRKIKELKPDLVHGQGTERESALTAVLSGYPSLITLHGNFRVIAKILSKHWFDYYALNARMETWTLRRATGIICISHYVKKITCDFVAKKWVVPNPVLSRFLVMKRPLAPVIPRVISLGTIDKLKQSLLILEACEYLWIKGLVFEFHVYGGSRSNEGYPGLFFQRLKIFEEKGLAFYHGMVKDPASVIASAHILVSASQEESFGMNILEAMALGTPTVAPAIGGIVDILVEGQTGLYYQANSVEDCADKMATLLQDPTLWEVISAKGRKRAEQFFSIEVVATETMRVYQKVLSQH